MATQRESSPRVLYLSFYFPPSRASGVFRARATANYLAQRGWEVTTFTAPLRFLYEVVGSADEALADTVDPRIRVERPPIDMFAWEHDLRRIGWFRGTFPILAPSLHKLRIERLFPEQYGSWGRASLRRALALHRRQRFDVVLATGNPYASFAAAWLFHRLTGVPYVVDYRDAWTLDLFTDGPTFRPSHPAWKWESRVLGRASAAVFVNEALRSWHAERYPAVADRLLVVPNGWDPDLMPVLPAPATADRAGPLSFSFLGTLTQNQPVEVLATAFHRARSHPELRDAELNLYGYLGYFKRRSAAAVLERLGLTNEAEAASESSGIRYRGPVPKTEVASVYQEADVLVLLAGGGRYVTSGKVFEYMATGRPIVSVHAPDSAACEVLRGYPLWFNPGSLDPDEVAQAMVAAGKAARDEGPGQHQAARRHADRYARDRLLEPLERRLRSLAGVPETSNVPRPREAGS